MLVRAVAPSPWRTYLSVRWKMSDFLNSLFLKLAHDLGSMNEYKFILRFSCFARSTCESMSVRMPFSKFSDSTNFSFSVLSAQLFCKCSMITLYLVRRCTTNCTQAGMSLRDSRALARLWSCQSCRPGTVVSYFLNNSRASSELAQNSPAKRKEIFFV